MFSAAYVCGADAGLRVPGCVDFYGIFCQPHLADAVHFLPGVVDNYFYGAYDMLCGGQKKTSKAGNAKTVKGYYIK